MAPNTIIRSVERASPSRETEPGLTRRDVKMSAPRGDGGGELLHFRVTYATVHRAKARNVLAYNNFESELNLPIESHDYFIRSLDECP